VEKQVPAREHREQLVPLDHGAWKVEAVGRELFSPLPQPAAGSDEPLDLIVERGLKEPGVTARLEQHPAQRPGDGGLDRGADRGQDRRVGRRSLRARGEPVQVHLQKPGCGVGVVRRLDGGAEPGAHRGGRGARIEQLQQPGQGVCD